MSCITEILKMKGDKDVFIPLNKDGKPWIAVEGGGTYKDYEYLIVLNHMGHRCGYVAIPPEHKANNIGQRVNTYTKEEELDYSALDIECHGGLTFGGKHHGLKKLLTNTCEDNWIGFDCCHLYDASDYELLTEYFGEQTESRKSTLSLLNEEGTVKTFKYVEKECKSIIDQLIEKAA